MVDSAARFSAMARIPSDHILSISLRDSNEVAVRLNEAKANHEGLILRRVVFDSSTCNALWKALKFRQDLNKPWKKVELRNVNGDVAAAMSVCTSLDAIEEFQLVVNNTEIGFGGWFALSVGMQVNCNLSCLRITTVLNAAGMSSLAKGLKKSCSSLRTLDFSWSTLDEDDAVLELAMGLSANKTLHELHFMGCSLRDARAAQLVESLCNHPCLRVLDLNGNKAASCTSRALGLLLKSNQSLKKVDISFQTNNERMNISLLAESLRQNTILKTLDLSNCQLDDADIEILGHLLCETNSLEELFIARNKISDEGIRSLARMLAEMKGLKRLSIWGNPFGDEGAKALSLGLERNVELEEVDLVRTFPCTEMITHYLQLNKAGRRLMHAPGVPLGLWPLILERVGKLSYPNGSKFTARDLQFYMLRGPALLHNG